MPTIQLIINMPFLVLGYLVKALFFSKKGFGKDYIIGIKEGISSCHKCSKVPFTYKSFIPCVLIQFILNIYMFQYTIDWLQRKAKGIIHNRSAR